MHFDWNLFCYYWDKTSMCFEHYIHLGFGDMDFETSAKGRKRKNDTNFDEDDFSAGPLRQSSKRKG